MNLSDRSTIQLILGRHGFKFSKALGQNFIIDPDVCPEMAECSGCDKNALVIEIGPGIGVLTKELCLRAGKVVAIELDKRLLPVLAETMAEFDNFEVIHGDVMQLDLSKLIADNVGSFTSVHICANLPYYITSPIVMLLLEQKLKVDSITVMVQKEAAVRLCAVVGTRECGAVSVAVNYFSQAEMLFAVPRDCFLPAPKVDSAVIRLAVRAQPPVVLQEEANFFALVKAAFGQRRKTALNAISAGLGVEKEKLKTVIISVGAAADVRAEKLTMEQLAQIANALSNEIV